MFIKTLSLLAVLVLLPDIYIYLVHIVKLTDRKLLRMLWFLPMIALIIYMMTVRMDKAAAPDHQHAVGVFMIIFMLICVPKALFFIIDAVGHVFPWSAVRKTFTTAGILAALAAIFILLAGYFKGRNHFVVKEQTMEFDDLPDSFDGYRVAFFSDMHIGTFRKGNEKDVADIVNLVNKSKPDVILFGGDLVNYTKEEIDGFESQLNSLKAKDGVYAIMGNHDYSIYKRYDNERQHLEDIKKLETAEKDLGWKLLLNENDIIRRNGDSIVIAGSENDGKPPFPSLGNLKKTLNGINNNAFCILLTHDPTHWRRKVIPETNVQLTLSGHTHAGQFIIFGWSPTKYVYDEWYGLYEEGKQKLFVSAGIGTVMFPFRFGAWPELNIFTLKKAKQH